MKRLCVECLSCGERREVAHEPRRALCTGECARCGYVGWRPAAALDERLRRVLRELPPHARRLHAV
jgi:hypothetical protein